MKIGRITGNEKKRSILQQIRTKRDEVVTGAGLGEDCAVFSFSNHRCMGTVGARTDNTDGDSIGTESVIAGLKPGKTDDDVVFVCAQEGFLSEEVSITHLLQRCVNGLAAKGGEPAAVSLRFLLPEDAEEPFLKASMAEAEKFCEKLRIQIAGAEGRVAREVTAPYATVTGYGVGRGFACEDSCGCPVDESACVDKKELYLRPVRSVEPRQDIVLSKWIGLEGTAVLAKRHRDMLLERYPSWLVEEAAGFDRYLSTTPEAAVAAKAGVYAMRNVSEGGIFAALWELAEEAGVGLTVDIKKIPLRQETVEVCNYCGINPYELMSGGCLMMLCEDGERLVEALELAEIPAAVIGRITDGNDRLILNEDEVRYLDRPAVDGIYWQ